MWHLKTKAKTSFFHPIAALLKVKMEKVINTSDGSGYYHGKDGSEGYIYSDGSGYYHGADGSEGYIYSDGSAYYHGADGSDGYKYSDGSGYFNGADGSRGNKYSDGSGSYQDGNGSSSYYDADDDDDSDDSGSSLGDIIGGALGVGLAGLCAALWRNSKRKNASKEKKQPNAKRFVNGIGNLFFYVYWLWF